jgi:hypothetical protein
MTSRQRQHAGMAMTAAAAIVALLAAWLTAL